MDFKQLLTNQDLLAAIEASGYTTPTPIQAQAIPKILEGKDLRASAQTGTGKTAAFILPTLQKLAANPSKGRGPRVLVLVPTRELAMQVAKEAAKYSKNMPAMKVVCIYGGAPYPIQNKDLSRPYEILVATPGRLMDHMERGRIPFDRLELMILDEADRMLDMGFIGPVEDIAAATPATRQTLMFSATFNKNVLGLSKRLLKNPVEITIDHEQAKHENIEQFLLNVDDLTHKYRLLEHYLADEKVVQIIVFTATKRQADVLVDVLAEKGHEVEGLHGDMNQRQRSRTIEKLRRGNLRILVATDVAARGIDVPTISHIVNFDLPNSPEDYVHRIGRTGRAGKSGIAIAFASPKDRHVVKEIERYTGFHIAPTVIPGLEPKFKAFPSSSTRPGASGPKRSFAPRKKSYGSNFASKKY
jgi:superfamily II DNA/RNA helicase